MVKKLWPLLKVEGGDGFLKWFQEWKLCQNLQRRTRNTCVRWRKIFVKVLAINIAKFLLKLINSPKMRMLILRKSDHYTNPIFFFGSCNKCATKIFLLVNISYRSLFNQFYRKICVVKLKFLVDEKSELPQWCVHRNRKSVCFVGIVNLNFDLCDIWFQNV